MPMKRVEGTVREHDTRVWRIIEHHVHTARAQEDFSEVRRVGMDETVWVATPVETAQVIRFALGGLTEKNGHHSFEHLCRQVAKRRIASNVLPATGPVSAGGDQGRDFETFRTYLWVEELPFALGFLALASRDVVVFACTIQRDKLRCDHERSVRTAQDRVVAAGC